MMWKNDETYKAWLDSLKVGDYVFVVTQNYGDIRKRLAKIDRITPKRQIVIGDERYKNGQLPHGTWATVTTHIEEVTGEGIQEYKKDKYMRRIRKEIFNSVDDLTYEQAVEIAKIVGLEVPNDGT